LAGTAGVPAQLIRLLVLDAVLIAAVVIGAALEVGRLGTLLSGAARIGAPTAHMIVLIGAGVLGLPFLIGLTRTARRLGAANGSRHAPIVAVDIDVRPAEHLLVLYGAARTTAFHPFEPCSRGSCRVARGGIP
jgi:hypothetical protein